jgi:hypothetical protein
MSAEDTILLTLAAIACTVAVSVAMVQYYRVYKALDTWRQK